jgi:4-hydroxybenzoate polyprenyltransferase
MANEGVAGPVGGSARESAGWLGRAKLLASLSRLHIMAIGAMGTFTFGWAFTGGHMWGLALICATDWFVVNLLNRAVDLEEDKVNQIRGTGFVERHRRGVLVAGFAVLGLSLLGVHLVVPEITVLRVIYHSLGLAYNWPLLPGGLRIKELYFFKNTASALGFVVTVFCYPMAVAGWGAASGALLEDVSAASVVAAALFFVLFELSYEVIYDLRDVEGDRAAGVRSYPAVHGVEGAARIVDGLIASSFLVAVGAYAAGVLPWRITIMAAAPLINLVFYKRALRRGITSGDCIRLTWLGVALLTVYHLWVAAGLPGAGIPGAA